MKLTTETAKELKIVIENEIFFEGKNRYKEGYAHGRKDSIISFKNELKDIVYLETPYHVAKIAKLKDLIKEIESVENG